MKGRAKVQMNGPRLFIYLPTKQSAQDKIVKGSFVDFDIANTGLDPEPPTRRALAMGNNNPQRIVD